MTPTPTPRGDRPDNDRPEREQQMGQFQPPQEQPGTMPRRGSTSAQLKRDINSGLTGDKVNFFDPAAAPLGTDEEAGGASPTPEDIHEARMAERSRAFDAPGADARTSPHGATDYGSVYTNEDGPLPARSGVSAGRWFAYWVAIAVIALIVFLVVT